ncbi:MAG: hypothetical protein KVP17_002820, partial [Porospora cf. gigantea B]|uniref:uncharacterized protein n=1 Tax=Porospora cf. gigantea B TaxID=2853592 RepID=UPI003571E2B8
MKAGRSTREPRNRADILANLGGLLKKTTDAATREDSWLSSAKNLVQSAAAAAQQAVVLTSEQRPNLLFTQKGLRKEPGGQDRISAFLPATTDRFVVPADFQRSPPLAPRPSPRLSDTESDSPSSTGLSDSAFRERSSRRRLPPSRAQGALYQRRPSGQYNAKPGGTDQDELMVFLASQYCTPAQHPDESNMARLLETAQWENVAVVETSPIAVAETCENVYERMVASAFNGCSTPDLVRSSPDGAPANTSSRRSYEEVMWRVHEADALPSPKTVCIGLRSPSKAPGADSKPTGQAGPEVPLRVAEEPASPSSTSAPSFVDMKSGSVECPVVTSLPVPPLLPMEPVPPVAVVESTSPPEAVAKSTSPPEAVVNPTSPPKAVVKSTSPPEAVVELSGPSQAVVKRSEPSDSALAPEPNNSCLPTSAVERSDSNIAPDLTNLATEEGASSTAPRKKQRVHAGHARNGPGRTRLESSDMPSQSSPSDTIQPPSPQVRRVQHIVTGSSDSSIPRDLL